MSAGLIPAQPGYGVLRISGHCGGRPETCEAVPVLFWRIVATDEPTAHAQPVTLATWDTLVFLQDCEGGLREACAIQCPDGMVRSSDGKLWEDTGAWLREQQRYYDAWDALHARAPHPSPSASADIVHLPERDPRDRLLNMTEVSALLSISPQTIKNRYLNHSDWPAPVMISQHPKYWRSEVLAFLEKRRAEAS